MAALKALIAAAHLVAVAVARPDETTPACTMPEPPHTTVYPLDRPKIIPEEWDWWTELVQSFPWDYNVLADEEDGMCMIPDDVRKLLASKLRTHGLDSKESSEEESSRDAPEEEALREVEVVEESQEDPGNRITKRYLGRPYEYITVSYTPFNGSSSAFIFTPKTIWTHTRHRTKTIAPVVSTVTTYVTEIWSIMPTVTYTKDILEMPTWATDGHDLPYNPGFYSISTREKPSPSVTEPPFMSSNSEMPFPPWTTTPPSSEVVFSVFSSFEPQEPSEIPWDENELTAWIFSTSTFGVDESTISEPQSIASSTFGVVETSTDTLVEASTDTPAETSTEVIAEVSTDTPTETSTDASVETSTEIPVETSTGTLFETSTDTPIESSTDAPIETSTDIPIESSTEAPIETSTETPIESSTEAPVETSTETPVETPTETPVETSTESPIETSTDTPVDAFIVTLVETTTVTLVDTSTDTSSETSIVTPTETSTDTSVETSTLTTVETPLDTPDVQSSTISPHTSPPPVTVIEFNIPPIHPTNEIHSSTLETSVLPEPMEVSSVVSSSATPLPFFFQLIDGQLVANNGPSSIVVTLNPSLASLLADPAIASLLAKPSVESTTVTSQEDASPTDTGVETAIMGDQGATSRSVFPTEFATPSLLTLLPATKSDGPSSSPEDSGDNATPTQEYPGLVPSPNPTTNHVTTSSSHREDLVASEDSNPAATPIPIDPVYSIQDPYSEAHILNEGPEKFGALPTTQIIAESEIWSYVPTTFVTITRSSSGDDRPVPAEEWASLAMPGLVIPQTWNIEFESTSAESAAAPTGGAMSIEDTRFCPPGLEFLCEF